MLGRRSLVRVWMLALMGVLTAATGCAASTGSDPPAAGISDPAAHRSSTAHSPADVRAPGGPARLSAADRALALAAAHHEANQLAVRGGSQQGSGWPSGISAVIATVRPGTQLDSNTGHTCDSGTIIDVRLEGAFNTTTTGLSSDITTAIPDTTVREMDLSVDETTGLICLIGAQTEPQPRSTTDSVLYSR